MGTVIWKVDLKMKLLSFLALAYTYRAHECLYCSTAWLDGEIILSEDENGAWLGEDCFLGNSTYTEKAWENAGCGVLKFQLWEGDKIVGYAMNRDTYDDELNPAGISFLEVNEKAIGCTGQSCPTHYEAFAALGTKPKCAEFASFDKGPNLLQKKRRMQAKISTLIGKYRTTENGANSTKMPASCPKCKMNSFISTSREDCNAVEPTECYSNDAVCQGYYEQVVLDHSRTGKQTALCELEMSCGWPDDDYIYQYLFDTKLCYEDKCNNAPWTPYNLDIPSS